MIDQFLQLFLFDPFIDNIITGMLNVLKIYEDSR